MKMDDGWLEFLVILGQGSLHDLSEADPRNPRLAGFKSVSFGAACALRKDAPPCRPIGFHKPK